GLDLGGEAPELLLRGARRLRGVEPAQPARLVRGGPERGVAGPQARDLLRALPLVELARDRGAERLGQLPARRGRGLEAPDQLDEGVGEELQALDEQLVGDLRERDARALELGELRAGLVEARLEARARLAVVAAGVDGPRR